MAGLWDDSCKRILITKGQAAVCLFFLDFLFFFNRVEVHPLLKKTTHPTVGKMITAQVKVLGCCDWWIGFGFGDGMVPIESMSGIFTCIWLISVVNVGKYTRHGCYGVD